MCSALRLRRSVASTASAIWMGTLAACGGGGSGDLAGPPGGGDPGAVDSLVLNLDSAEVIIDDTLRLTAVARDAHGDPVPGIPLVWSSTDPGVATVSADGLVTAVDLGEAEIEVSIAGASQLQASTTMPELAVAAVQGGRKSSKGKVFSVPNLEITPGEQSVDIGAVVQYTVTLTDANDRPLRNQPRTGWSSSDPSVATVDITGKATALHEGTTQIKATIPIGRLYLLGKSVLLRVGACGGITNVQGWDVSVQVDYSATASQLGVAYTVSQVSSATGPLLRNDETKPEGSLASWDGFLTGTGQINNRLTDQFGTETETGSGPLILTYSRLSVFRWPDQSCTVDVVYEDEMRWLSTRNGSTSGPLGTATLIGKVVGTRPADGKWKIGATALLEGIYWLGEPSLAESLPFTYAPKTSIASTMFSTTPNPNEAKIGKAVMTYSYVAR